MLKYLQGFVLAKPHGYAGDFEIVDGIYAQYVASLAIYQKWDRSKRDSSAPRAVRNRKNDFKHVVSKFSDPMGSVSNVASGPCRDVSKMLREYSSLIIM